MVRVLIVDDVEDVRLLLRLRLQLVPGIEVVGEAGDGQAAVAAAKALQPGAIVLDEAMPTMTGSAAIPHLRTGAPHSRIILHSAALDPASAEASLADAFVTKGEFDELVQAVLAADAGEPQPA